MTPSIVQFHRFPERPGTSRVQSVSVFEGLIGDSMGSLFDTAISAGLQFGIGYGAQELLGSGPTGSRSAAQLLSNPQTYPQTYPQNQTTNTNMQWIAIAAIGVIALVVLSRRK